MMYQMHRMNKIYKYHKIYYTKALNNNYIKYIVELIIIIEKKL